MNAGVDLNALDNCGHTALDMLIAEAGPSFFNNGLPINGSIDWSHSANSTLKNSRAALVAILEKFGAKNGIEVAMLNRSQPMYAQPMDIDEEIADEDGASEAGQSDFSEVPMLIDVVEAVGPIAPPEFISMIYSSNIPDVESFVSKIDESALKSMMSRADSSGNLPVHALAATPTRFRRTYDDTTTPDLTAAKTLVDLVTQSGTLDMSTIDVFNVTSLTPLALSILADSRTENVKYSLFSTAKVKPRVSALTGYLEDAGFTVAKIDKNNQNVIHGAIKEWLASCSEEAKNVREGKPNRVKDLHLNPERTSSGIKAFSERGVDINLQDQNGHTPLDLLIATPGPEFLAKCQDTTIMDWNAEENGKFKQYRDSLVGYMLDMGARRGLDLDLMALQTGGKSWIQKRNMEHTDAEPWKKIRLA
ncbi:hypothetical protein HDU99_002996 [Rhizoclosmatium hyalinum]|nr:hypothetical protein HDU99_002996 [Rhizoclosmatium hyalinum]